MTTDAPVTPPRSVFAPLSLLFGWDGMKLLVALVLIPILRLRVVMARWLFDSVEYAWGKDLAPLIAQTYAVELPANLLLLVQIWLLLSIVARRLKAPRWRTVLLVCTLGWLAWGAMSELRLYQYIVGGYELLRISPLWFASYSVLIAWTLWDEERLTVRLIVSTIVTTLLFRFWIYDDIGRWRTMWVVLIFAHGALFALAVGALRFFGWRWQPPDAVTTSNHQIDERHQFRFIHLLIAIACAAVLVTGLGPDTQLHHDLADLFRTWQKGRPLEWALLMAIPVLSTALTLLGTLAAFDSQRKWFLLAAAVLGIALAFLIPDYLQYLVAVNDPLSPLALSWEQDWPKRFWDWAHWSVLLTAAPYALFTAQRSAGYRWVRNGQRLR